MSEERISPAAQEYIYAIALRQYQIRELKSQRPVDDAAREQMAQRGLQLSQEIGTYIGLLKQMKIDEETILAEAKKIVI